MKEIAVPTTTVLKALESDFNERTYADKFVSQENVGFGQLLLRQKEDEMK